jgi:hypothetical protein
MSLMSMLGMVLVFNADNMLGYILCATGAFTILTLKLSAQIFYSNWKFLLFRYLYAALWLTVVVPQTNIARTSDDVSDNSVELTNAGSVQPPPRH